MTTTSAHRNFSTPIDKSSAVGTQIADAKPDDQSIFASADYFKDVKEGEIASSSSSEATQNIADAAANNMEQMMWLDANDSLGSSLAYMAKDVNNLVQGVRTYGFSEMLIYYETLLWDLWTFFAETQGFGMGAGLIAASFVSRGLFAPVIIYGQTMGKKMQLLQPDSDEVMAAMKRH